MAQKKAIKFSLVHTRKFPFTSTHAQPKHKIKVMKRKNQILFLYEQEKIENEFFVICMLKRIIGKEG